jgi:AraC-like DNA-binding protein
VRTLETDGYGAFKKTLLIDGGPAKLCRSRWLEGGTSLPAEWPKLDDPRISFPAAPLLVGTRRRSQLAPPGTPVVFDGWREPVVRRAVADASGHTLWINVDPTVFDDLCVPEVMSRVRGRASREGHCVLRPDAWCALAVAGAARWAESGRANDAECGSLLLEVVGHAFARVGPSPIPPAPSTPAVARAHEEAVVHAIGLLSDPSASYSLAEIGGRVHIAPHHFCRIFKRSTGMTIHEFRRRVRLHCAARRVIARDGTLSAIAHACGYADQAHMTRSFCRVLGIPPGRLSENAFGPRGLRTALQEAGPGAR